MQNQNFLDPQPQQPTAAPWRPDFSKMRVVRIEKSEWAEISAAAHELVFNKIKPATFDRIDFALMAIQHDKPAVYVTVRELDPESVYWQFGGGFPWAKKSIWVPKAVDAFLEHLKQSYKRVSCRVENTNIPMLRLALSKGFLINGTLTCQNSVMVAMTKELI